MKVSKDYLNFQPCALEGAKANKWRWFERCIGALDGTHIPVTVSPDERPRYCNRKGDVSTNVLAACGPYSRFIYVLPGWEGSARDKTLISFERNTIRTVNLPASGTCKKFESDQYRHIILILSNSFLLVDTRRKMTIICLCVSSDTIEPGWQGAE
ncbi:hypothetical protein GmHk_20G057129 [Glycine max]|nr:hypothetical protein GmHk_20G057129 [Glycine max]